jgi:hypothetical protein
MGHVAPLRYSRGEGGALLLGQAQSIRERAYGVRIRTPPLAALEGADALGGQASPRGQLLLRKAGCLAQLPEPQAERGIRLLGHVARTDFTVNLPTIPQLQSMVADGAGGRRTSPALPRFDCGSSVGAVWMVHDRAQTHTGSGNRTKGRLRQEERRRWKDSTKR